MIPSISEIVATWERVVKPVVPHEHILVSIEAHVHGIDELIFDPILESFYRRSWSYHEYAKSVLSTEYGPTVVYVVYGKTGEYSDQRAWAVSAWYTETAAASAEARLNEWAREHGVSTDASSYEDRERAQNEGNPLDPDMEVSYTGVEYFVSSVPLYPL